MDLVNFKIWLSETAACDGQTYTGNFDSPCTGRLAKPLPFFQDYNNIRLHLNI